MTNTTLNVSGMSCSHCEKAVTNALTDIGVNAVTVSLAENTVTVEFDETKVSLDAIKAEIVETGYEVV